MDHGQIGLYLTTFIRYHHLPALGLRRSLRRFCRDNAHGGATVSILVELPVLIATFLGLISGALCIYWARVRPCARRGRWGCRLFVATLLGLGAVALFAAFMRADGLAPLGLLSGLLTVGMLWESPTPVVQDEQ
jgi:hypothetical protein